MADAVLGSASLYYERGGAGPPLLLVSGLGGMASFWEAQRACLERRFDVIRYDHRGSGRSTRSPPPYSIAGMARDALALLDHLNVHAVRFVGHSTGGAIGQWLAAHVPERIDRLVLSATWTHADAFFRRLFTLRRDLVMQADTDFYTRLSALMLYPPEWIAAHEREIVEERSLTGEEREIISGKLEALLAFDGRADLAKIRCPTLVIAARDDATVPSYFSVALASSIPNARLTLLESGGHYCPISRAHEFATAVETFLVDPELV